MRLRELAAVASAFLASLAVLLASVRTGVGWWDTGDLQTVSWIAGIPYPTGFPGYVLLGWLWTHLVPLGGPAFRLNALSAVAVAAAAAAVSAIALLLRVRPWAAALCALLFALAHPVWERATYADVHPVGFALALLALLLALRWSQSRDARALCAAIVTVGATVAVDNSSVLLLPAVAVAACGTAWPLRGALLAALGALVLTAAAYAYLPLRSAYVVDHGLDPTLALGIAPGRPYWDDHDPRTVQGFRALVSGDEFAPRRALLQIFTPAAVARSVERFRDEVQHDFPQGLLIAAVLGLGALAAQAPQLAIALALAALVPALFGGSYPVEADPERYAFGLYAVLALGVALAAERVLRAFESARAGGTAGATTAALLGLALLAHVVRGSDITAGRDDRGPAAFADRVARVTRDGAVVVAEWSFASPLAYAAYVEHRLGSRIVVCEFPVLLRDKYDRWLRDRQVVIAGQAPPVFAGLRTRLLSDGSPALYELLP